MFVPRIYYACTFVLQETILLNKEISHYLFTVLRLKNGEKVIFFNGQGGEYLAQIHLVSKTAQAQIIDFFAGDKISNLSIHLGQSVVRGDRMDFVIQKATELGVTSITPLLSANSIVRLDEKKLIKKTEQWLKIAISAAEQCGRTEIPVLHLPLCVKKWVQLPFSGTSIVFDLPSKQPIRSLTPSHAIRLAIGPESGWDQNEITLMKDENFIALSLGSRILRTETASITALSILQGLFGDI